LNYPGMRNKAVLTSADWRNESDTVSVFQSFDLGCPASVHENLDNVSDFGERWICAKNVRQELFDVSGARE